ncbi:MAG TPA: hydrogenase assembly protein HupF [Desulfobulbaceae bacterium]|nr:hydrogenase assembly protein HupF [Desulfobulbaceae bacterium]
MCIAIPMRVLATSGQPGDPFSNPTAVVEAGGAEIKARLDIIDRWPEVGDYVIIHAGFAIHRLDAEEARINLNLFRELADKTGVEISGGVFG